MIETICSTLFCLQSTLALGEIPKVNQYGDYVTIETISHHKYTCSKIAGKYQCLKYQ